MTNRREFLKGGAILSVAPLVMSLDAKANLLFPKSDFEKLFYLDNIRIIRVEDLGGHIMETLHLPDGQHEKHDWGLFRIYYMFKDMDKISKEQEHILRALGWDRHGINHHQVEIYDPDSYGTEDRGKPPLGGWQGGYDGSWWDTADREYEYPVVIAVCKARGLELKTTWIPEIDDTYASIIKKISEKPAFDHSKQKIGWHHNAYSDWNTLKDAIIKTRAKGPVKMGSHTLYDNVYGDKYTKKKA